MSWKLDYKGNKRMQKKETVGSLEALREIIKAKFELPNNDF
jgi:hypothetical protein